MEVKKYNYFVVNKPRPKSLPKAKPKHRIKLAAKCLTLEKKIRY